MNWIQLTDIQQLDAIKELSQQKPQVIFKHSTRCSISSMVLNRFERADEPAQADYYFLDLIAHRDISNAIAEKFDVHHESPQVLLISKGECVFDESHHAITMDEITEQIAQLN